MLLESSDIVYNSTTNIVTIEYKNSLKYKNIFESFLKNLFFSIQFYFLKKIKFKGKSYKIEKVNKKKYIYEFNFGHSIFTCSIFKNVKIKQIQKVKLFLWSVNNLKLIKNATNIRTLRPWNKYSQRGLRLGKQLIYKKTGKKSTFV